MSDIFISYKREDQPAADLLREKLKEHGFSVWWDRKIPAGRSFDDGIQEALDKASCVIVLWSKLSVQSDWVKEEAEKGASRGVLVPVLIDDVQPPLGFGRLQTASIAGWEGDRSHPGFVQLARSIEIMLGGPVEESDVWQPATRSRPETQARSRRQERQSGNRRASSVDRRSGDRRAWRAKRRAGRRWRGRVVSWAGLLLLAAAATYAVWQAGGPEAAADKVLDALEDGYAWVSAKISPQEATAGPGASPEPVVIAKPPAGADGSDAQAPQHETEETGAVENAPPAGAAASGEKKTKPRPGGVG